MSYDIHSILAYSAVATAPSPATSGTSIVLTAGEGARFPSSGSFDVLIWPTGTSPPSWSAGLATGGNFEICRATRTVDTLALTRAQNGTTARSILVGDQVAQPFLPRDLTDIEASSTTASGVISAYAGRTPPAGSLACDGTAYSRTTYLALYQAIVPSVGTCTITLASPGIVTRTAHGLYTGDKIFLTTTGALPTGVSVNTIYWVTRVDADTFKLATSHDNAVAVININTSVSQSGVHTLWDCPWGLGDGSTTFNVPDLNGRTLVGAVVGTGGHSDVTLGNTEGVALLYRAPEHNHTVVQPTISSPSITVGQPTISSPSITQPTISAPAINVVQPTITKPNVTINDTGHFHSSGLASGGSGSVPQSSGTGNTGIDTGSKTTGITASLASTPTASGGTATLANAPVATGAALASAPVATGATATLASAPIATAGTVGPGGTLAVDTPAWAGVRYIIWV